MALNDYEAAHKNAFSFSHETTREELVLYYDTWSKTYDADVTQLQYIGPEFAAKYLPMEEFGFDHDARILDMGCGTGLVGVELHKLGYRNIDALDLSEKCLELAKQRGVYTNVIRGFMASEKSRELGVKNAQYDAAISIGVFSLGHVKAKGFHDLVHVVKPGGLACFSVREDVHDIPEYGYHEKMDELTREEKWQLVRKVRTEGYSTVVEAWIYVYQIL